MVTAARQTVTVQPGSRLEVVAPELATGTVTEVMLRVPPTSRSIGEIFNQAGRGRGALADCMIAAASLRSGTSLETENPADCSPLLSVGLKIFPSISAEVGILWRDAF
jgi:hypothetical protein